MNKTEFLKTLKGKLKEELTDAQVNEHIRYYDQYISDEIQNGSTEKEVLDSLGDPLLLARTILETSTKTTGGYTEQNVGYESNPTEETYRKINITSGWGCALAVIIALVVLSVVLWLVGAIVSVALPIIMPVVLILFVIALFKKGR